MTPEARTAVATASAGLLLLTLDVLACARAWWASPLCLPWHACR